MPTCRSLSFRHIIFWGVILLLLGGIWFLPPIPQDSDYHAFVDIRPLLSIPHASNVLSNLPYLLFGWMGWRVVTKKDRTAFVIEGERRLWRLFFTSLMLVCGGSAYYHLEPNNWRLIWDRTPIVIGFMALYAIVLTERYHPKARHSVWLLAPVAVATIFLWYDSSLGVEEDMRAYILVQAIPIVTIPLLLMFFPPRYSHGHYYWYMLSWYLAAKLFEFNDGLTYQMTQELFSGHMLKHLASAMSGLMAVQYLCKRQTLSSTHI